MSLPLCVGATQLPAGMTWVELGVEKVLCFLGGGGWNGGKGCVVLLLQFIGRGVSM
jgi:hypothetical protein